ncbi:MAG: RluA family pseudouridine synthase [Ruminococcus sp.]
MSGVLTFTVTDEFDGKKAVVFLRTVCKLSARTLALLKKTEGGLTLSGKTLRTVDIVHSGDVVKIALPQEQTAITPIKGELDILYEDSSLLIINKPSATPVHPVKSHQTDTLANFVAYKYMNSSADFVFRAVNRLDSDTSGAVIIARDRHTASLMQSIDVKKYYIAVCHGKIVEKGSVRLPIALSADSKIRREVNPNGKSAVTYFEPIKALNDATVVRLCLETGRTHQIRCHMSHIGHPLLGDDIYGGSLERIGRQALHCFEVSFVHPITAETVSVTAPIPQDMKALIESDIERP